MKGLILNVVGLVVTGLLLVGLRQSRVSIKRADATICSLHLFAQIIILLHLIACALNMSLGFFTQSYISWLSFLLSHLSFFFHEAGHLIFFPLGDFLSSFGGTLTEFALVGFLVHMAFRRKCYAIFSLGIYWLGVMLSYTAWYIGDTKNGFINTSIGSHDWYHMLGVLGIRSWAPLLSSIVLYWSVVFLIFGCCLYVFYCLRPRTAKDNLHSDLFEGASFITESQEGFFLISQFRFLFRRFLFRFFLKPRGNRKELFDMTFIMLTQMAAADGEVGADEISAIERFGRDELNLSKKKLLELLQTVRKTKRSPGDLRHSASQLYRLVNGNKILIEAIFDSILSIAHADYVFSIEERALFNSAGKICKLSEEDLIRIRARHEDEKRIRESFYGARRTTGRSSRKFKSTGRERKKSSRSRSGRDTSSSSNYAGSGFGQLRCYQILGASETEAFASIKKKYRKLVKKTHPDIVLANGAPEELRSTIEARFREVQAAYEEVCRLRGES